MGLRINTNVASLRAQAALSASTKKLNTAMTRLSTGLRINNGSDDPVGLAKSEALRTRIRGIETARLNITTSSSVLGVAEGYLAELTEVVQSMREVSLQAADATISSDDRSTLIDRFATLMDEYNRLTSNAKFNTTSLLDGTFTNKVIQAGTEEGDTITLSISDARSSTVGEIAIYTSQTRTAVSTAAGASNLNFGDPAAVAIGSTSITGFTSDGVSVADDDESALAYVNAINALTSTTGVTARVNSNVVTVSYSAGTALLSNHNLVINGITVKSDTTNYSVNDDDDAATLVSLINSKSSQTGVTAVQQSGANTFTLTATDGRNISVEVTGGTGDATNVFGITGSGTNTTVAFRGTFRLTSDEAFSITGATDEFAGADPQGVNVDTNMSIDNTDLSTADLAGMGLTILDNAIRQLQARRAEVGSAINRLEISERELASRLENLSSAESRIRDADIAAETAKLTQANIIQQAAAVVLGQANAAPQIALVLLENL